MRHLKKFEEVTGDELANQIYNDFTGSNAHISGMDELCPECNCKPVDGKCKCEEENDEETTHGDENVEEVKMTENKLYTFSAFNEKKKFSKAQLDAQDAFAKRGSKKSDDKKAPAKKSDAKGKVPETEAEKKLAAKYGDKKRITKGDFIKAAIDNKKKKVSKEK